MATNAFQRMNFSGRGAIANSSFIESGRTLLVPCVTQLLKIKPHSDPSVMHSGMVVIDAAEIK